MRANENRVLTDKERKSMIKKLEKLYTKELQILGFIQELDYNLVETPLRKAKMMVNEKFRGCFTPEPKVTVFPNADEINNQLVMVENLKVKSTCSHHFADIMGYADVGIVYGRTVMGVSKFARIIDWYARRGQIQEELTNQVLDYIFRTVNPKYVILKIRAQHNCIAMRGAENEESKMSTVGERCGVQGRKIPAIADSWRQQFYNNLRNNI